jgi:hypothetical protein
MFKVAGISPSNLYETKTAFWKYKRDGLVPCGAAAPPDAEWHPDGAGAIDPPDDAGFADLLLYRHQPADATDRRLCQPGAMRVWQRE